MKTKSLDTIAAIATPLGEGGISIIRVSGSNAIEVAGRVFCGNVSLDTAATHTAHFGKIFEQNGDVIDEVVATVFRMPHSYTGENTVEIACHGGIIVTKQVLQRILGEGTRYAEPGEFTKRAFVNGKLDLSQAEAVADLIHAASTSAHRSSILQLEGVLSERIHRLRSQLIDSVGLLELELDFVEEDLEFVDKHRFCDSIETVQSEVQELLQTFKIGRIYREGVKVAIIGPPNAGKSSLLNAFLESSRAIVTEIPGTTRDTIEEQVSIGGLAFRLVDTAGIRRTNDVIELEGIKRTASEANNSDEVLLVVDASNGSSDPDVEILSEFCKNLERWAERTLVVLNKSDLPSRPTKGILSELGLPDGLKPIRISTKTRAGLNLLEEALLDRAISHRPTYDNSSATVTSARHYDALARAHQGLSLSLRSLGEGRSNEFVTMDLRNALDCLGEITGEVTTEEILNNIFSKFCIGK